VKKAIRCADWIALAFHAHVVSAYGKSRMPRPRRGGLAPHRLRYISERMIERMSDPISIAELAAQLDMTPGYFARAFRETTGEPPHRWLMRKRVECAKDLLRKNDLGLADIASACGFVDQSHFTRVFRCAEGRKPGQWRIANL
jgi:AraC family transcriptional regulator